MKISNIIRYALPYLIVLSLFLSGAIGINRTVSTSSLDRALNNRTRIVIDAGHGGEDGGATSCSGVLESQLNLEISIRLNDLLHLIGYPTIMIRTTDRSVHTSGSTIAQRKISDLKERVRIVNNTKEALLISIHQNYFLEERYHGAQVFYAKTEGSKELANKLQKTITTTLDPTNTRAEKSCSDVYLMEKVNQTAILIECGFISNREEERKLRTEAYQKNLCITIASSVSVFLDQQNSY